MLNERLFGEPGTNIKKIAKVLFYVEAILSLIGVSWCMISLYNIELEAAEKSTYILKPNLVEYLIYTAVIYLISLFFLYVSCLVLYGFGTLIVKSTESERTLYYIAKLSNSVDDNVREIKKNLNKNKE